MPTCASINCVNRQFRGCGKTFHRFPKTKHALQKWVTNMKRLNFVPSATAVLCSDHFENDCFDRTGQTNRLKKDAVPTVFQFPDHLLKKNKRRKLPTPRQNEMEVDISEENVCAPEPSTSSFQDHNYSIKDSPRHIKHKLNKALDNIETVKKRLKFTQQKTRRLKRRVLSLSTVVETLEKKNLISTNCAAILEKTYSGVPLEMMKRILSNKQRGTLTRESYPEVLRSFALTLQFYSTKAYNYVRKTFNFSLPHPSVIRRWYSSINGEPGFSDEVFQALKLKSENGNNKLLCSLMIDEMAIKKHIEWNGNKMVGFVDIGTDMEDDSTPVAAEALVFMIVSVNSNWKVPVGYFLISGMTGAERANLVLQCLTKLHYANVTITSLTCDGPSCHFSVMSHLGAILDPADLKPSFLHPVDQSPIFVLFDVCHMLKLLRNTLAVKGIMKDANGGKVQWKYFQALHKLQENEGLRLGNKLKAAHMDWSSQKMKVNLAAQTISCSVADAIQFCSQNLKLRDFDDSEPTVNFIRTVDRLFDILNSRNPLAKNFKSPLRERNETFWMPFLNETYQYISTLADTSGTLLTATKRRTPFIGFMCAIKSVIEIYKLYVKNDTAPLKYLLTYRLSQDHLELFFGAIRASGGCNNNPTVSQFIAAYKRLLMRHQIQSTGGNCISVDKTTILYTVRDSVSLNHVETDTLNMSVIRRYDLAERLPQQTDHDYYDIPNLCRLSAYKKSAVGYIAGYVVKMVEKIISCHDCIVALRHLVGSDANYSNPLVKLKSRGGLVNASASVVEVCQSTERAFQRLTKTTNGKLPQAHRVNVAVGQVVLEETVQKGVFSTLNEHMFDTTAENNHLFVLIKCICQCYCKIRMHHLAKQYNVKTVGAKVRKKFSKLILFNHQ